jgi:formylglycine-generating enzyme required for sulfatase activity
MIDAANGGHQARIGPRENLGATSVKVGSRSGRADQPRGKIVAGYMNDGLFRAKGLIPASALAVCCYTQSLQIEYVEIPAGEFTMGCLPSESPYMPDGSNEPCQKRAQPAHRVRISKPYEMSKYEVTQAQWETVMGATPSYCKGVDRPVEQVSFDEVQGFLALLNDRHDGYGYRLPTEAEWEYAARAGDTGEFPDSAPLTEIAWFGESRGSLTTSPGGTHPVGQKRPNAWGGLRHARERRRVGLGLDKQRLDER